ncbi:hypothetical protein ACP70R_041833 [Stipagrostis hirtigluma subsp. patula]
MPRRRGAPPIRRTDRDLAEEVLYLHSLWRRGPAAPAHARVPLPAAGPTSSRSTRLAGSKRKRRRPESGAAAEPQDAGSEWRLAPSPPASPKPWPDASASSSSPAKKPPPAAPPSPGSRAQREALRAAAEFFSGGGSDDEGSESEGDEEVAGFFMGLFERDAALRGHYEQGWEEGQFACMACAGRTARRGKARRFRGCVGLVQHARAAKRYGRPGAHRALAAVVCRVLGWDIERLPSIVMDPRGTLGQALAADPRAYAQEAKDNPDTGENSGSSSDDDDEKEDAETGMEDSSSDCDEDANELELSKESDEMEDVEEIGPLNCENDSKTKVLGCETVLELNANKDDSLRPDNDVEAHEQDINKECAEKENTNGPYLQSSKDTCKSEEHCKEVAIQEEDAEIGMEETSADCDEEEDVKEIGPMNCRDDSKHEVLGSETVQEVNANKDASLRPDNNEEVHKQDTNEEFAEKEKTYDTYHQSSKDTCKNEEYCKEAAIQEDVNVTESEKEHAKTADDTGETAIATIY